MSLSFFLYPVLCILHPVSSVPARRPSPIRCKLYCVVQRLNIRLSFLSVSRYPNIRIRHDFKAETYIMFNCLFLSMSKEVLRTSFKGNSDFSSSIFPDSTLRGLIYRFMSSRRCFPACMDNPYIFALFFIYSK